MASVSGTVAFELAVAVGLPLAVLVGAVCWPTNGRDDEDDE